MARTKRGTSRVVPFPTERARQKIEFPSLERFFEEVLRTDIRIVRLDVFSESRPSELSFVYYTTLTLYVTAQQSTGNVLYEYMEPLATGANTEPKFVNEEAWQMAQNSLQRATKWLADRGLETLGGRYTLLGYED